MRLRSGAVACLALLAVFVLGGLPARAGSGDLYFTCPWRWGASASITTYPFSADNGCRPNGVPPYECVAAYDVVISRGQVAAASEGALSMSQTFLPGECRATGGYGNYAIVDGVLYAHLDSFAPGIAAGVRVLQGDEVGTQGSTGNVKPCPGGVHLHWEFIGASVVPPIDNGSASSSNSLIGDSSAAGNTLRGSCIARWLEHGRLDVQHCPGTCTLDMTPYRSWGRMQDFQHDPDIFGGTFNTLHVSNYDPAHAYLVDSVFWQAWAAGEATRAIGMGVGERGACPAGFSAACISYQPFYAGFVWMDAFTGRQSVFCPDADGDFQVTISDLAIAAAYYLLPAPAGVRAVDADGDGVVTINDLAGMAGVFGLDCRR